MIIVNKYKYLLVCLLSFFYVLGFAPYNFLFLGFASIVGLSFVFSTINNKKDLILISLLCSLIISIFGAYWIIYASKYTFDSNILGIFVLLGFSLLYSVFIFIVTVPIYYANKTKVSYYFILIISWSTADAFKFYFLGGFPWFLSAYIWDNLAVIQIVSVIGIIGLSVLTYTLVFSIFIISNNKVSKFYKYNLVLLLLMMFLGIYVYGEARIKYLDSIPVKKNITIRLVQTNISQKEKMDLSNLKDISKNIITQSLSNLKKHSNTLVFFPEASFVFLDEVDLKKTLQLVPKNLFLVTGAIRVGENNSIYNSIISFNNNQVINYYDKVRLVPFGEKIPFSEYFPSILNIIGLSNFSEGSSFKILSTNNLKFAPTVCFEGLFPLEKINSNNIDFILNSANEAWFNKSIELEQNWDIYKYRSIELGVMAIKIANTGISGAYDFKGNVLFKMEPFIQNTVDITLPIKKVKTIFSEINYHIINYIIFFLYGAMFFVILSKK